MKEEGLPDFIGSEEICTMCWICSKCGLPCDPAGMKTTEELIRVIEVIINNHSPMMNFDVKGQCAKEIASLVKENIRLSKPSPLIPPLNEETTLQNLRS